MTIMISPVMTMTVIFPTGCGRTAARLGALNHRRREGVATQTEDKDDHLDGKDLDDNDQHDQHDQHDHGNGDHGLPASPF